MLSSIIMKMILSQFGFQKNAHVVWTIRGEPGNWTHDLWWEVVAVTAFELSLSSIIIIHWTLALILKVSVEYKWGDVYCTVRIRHLLENSTGKVKTGTCKMQTMSVLVAIHKLNILAKVCQRHELRWHCSHLYTNNCVCAYYTHTYMPTWIKLDVS